MLRFALLATLVALFAAPLAQAAPPPITAYAKFPEIDANHLDISPDGDRLAYAANTPTGRVLVVQDLTGKVLAQAKLGKTWIRAIEWAGDDHVAIATTSISDLYGVDKWQNYQVVVLNVVTHKSFAVFWSNPNIFHAIMSEGGYREINGHWYGYFGGVTLSNSGNAALDLKNQEDALQRMDHGYPDLYRVDLDTGAAELASGGGKNIDGWTLDGQGKVVAREFYNEASGELSVVDPSGFKKYLSVKSPLHRIGLAGLGRRPGTVIVHSEEAEGLVGSNELDLATGVLTPLLPGKHVTSYIHDHNHLLVGVRVGQRKIEMFDPALEAKYAAVVKPFPKLQHRFLGSDSGWNRWLLETTGDGDSGTYYLIDLANHQASIVGSAYPDVAPEAVGHAEVVDYKAADGLEMDGILTLPPGKTAKNLPLVVLPHGGPEGHDSLGFDWIAQAFASRGYAVWQPNFRGSDNSTIAFKEAGYGEWGRKMQTDISDGTQELVRRGVVDPKRACIVGASYGGYAALAGVTIQHGLYRCAVSYAGVSDLNAMLNWESNQSGLTNDVAGRYERKFMGATGTFDPRLHEISPADLASRADAPILLIHGKDDVTVPVEQSRRMASALRGAGKPVEVIEFDHLNHHLEDEPARIAFLEAAVAFVIKHNPPE